MPRQVQKIVQIALSTDDEAADVVYALDDAGQVWVGHWISDDVFDWGAPLPSLPDQTPSEVPPDGEG